MKPLTSQLYANETDLDAMIDLLTRSRPAAHIADYPGIYDLQELMLLPEVQQNTRLWYGNNGRLQAFAITHIQYHNIYFEIAPEIWDDTIAKEIFAWGEARIKRVYADASEPVTLDTSCREDDAPRLALLQRHGFVPDGVRSLILARSLHDPIPEPVLPDGYVIRAVAGESEAEALVALHRAAFGTANMTITERLAMMRAPEYDRELDLIAVAPDGRFAAFCVGSISAEENIRSGQQVGFTDPVGTHPDFQRRGLARALLLAGMRLLQKRGMETAVLGTSSQNIAMQKTAESVGFKVLSSKIWFTRPIER
ncbi:MAG: GNAT family N-acetyltransferase [Ardenticatenaceae bacterium]|nr:GNAT family N-acetyltransferase [Ardenticatenaceae bacterium]